jgi:hypothetical protein
MNPFWHGHRSKMVVDRRKLSLMLTCALLVAGCATTNPIAIPPDAVSDLQTAPACNLKVALIDRRQTTHLGYLGDREFVYPDYFEYLDRQIKQRFAGADSASLIHVQLFRAYLETNRSTLSFNTVLRVHRQDESDSEGRIYRGETTRVAWFGTDSELGTYIERATRDAVEKIAHGEGCVSAVRNAKP